MFFVKCAFCLTNFKHQLQGLRTVELSRRRVTIAKEAKIELSYVAILQRLRMGGRIGSENLKTLLSSKLAERQVFTFQDLQHSQCRYPSQSFDFHNRRNLFMFLKLSLSQHTLKCLLEKAQAN